MGTIILGQPNLADAADKLHSAGVQAIAEFADATNEAMQQLSEAAKSATFVLSAMPRLDDSITLKALNRKPSKRQQALQKRRGARHYDF